MPMLKRSFFQKVIEAVYDVQNVNIIEDRSIRAINASVPDLKPSMMQSAENLAKSPSFLQEFRANPLVAGRQSQPANFNFFANLSNFNLG